MKVACCNPLDTPKPPGPGSINHQSCVCVCVCVRVCVYLKSCCKSLLVVNNIKIFTNQITLIEWTMSCPWTAPNIFVMKIEKQWKLLIILIKFGNTEIFSDLHDIIDKLAHFLFHSVQFRIVLQRKRAKLWIWEQVWNTFLSILLVAKLIHKIT